KVMVTAILSPNKKRRIPFPDATLKRGDRLLMEGEPDALDKAVEQGGLTMSDRKQPGSQDDLNSIECIVGPASPLIGRAAGEYGLFERTGLNLLAVSRREKRFSERLSHITLEAGDVVLM